MNDDKKMGLEFVETYNFRPDTKLIPLIYFNIINIELV